MHAPNLEAVVDLYPWRPSLALFRALEWRAVHQYAMQLSEPILDLGCGDGAIARLVLGRREIVGVDRTRAPLETAKRVLDKSVQGDAGRLPFRNGSFGGVFGNCSVEHFPDLDLCLAEIGRVLRPDGILIATVPSGHWKALYVWNRFCCALGLPRLGRRLVDAHDRRMAHLNLFRPGEWTPRLQKAGFEPLAFVPYLAPRGARFATFVEWLFALPCPFPGFTKVSGTYYFLVGVLKRIGGERFWKPIFLRSIKRFYEEEVGPDGLAAGLVVVAQKGDGR